MYTYVAKQENGEKGGGRAIVPTAVAYWKRYQKLDGVKAWEQDYVSFGQSTFASLPKRRAGAYSRTEIRSN